MEVHDFDVSWMTNASPKDKANKSNSPPTKALTPAEARDGSDVPPDPRNPDPRSPLSQAGPKAATTTTTAATQNGSANGHAETPAPTATANGVNIPKRAGQSSSIDGKGPNGTPPPQRRNSWFSNISAKFSSSSPPNNSQLQQQNPPQSPTTSPEPQPPKITPTKNAVLPHAVRNEGTGPYTPAPPRSGQAGFLGVFRRLSSSGSGLGAGGKQSHGLVERRVLNVDRNRERCPISELNGAKLRRVAFSVDVEIAPMPRYNESDTSLPKLADKAQKKKLAEKGEADALKNPKAASDAKENEDAVGKLSELVPAEPEKGVTEKDKPNEEGINQESKDASTAKKKEKKKKSEEERKARKEKKRKIAEANGTIPMEIRYDSSDSTDEDNFVHDPPKMSSFPTTNPVRVYRRCCQLRETPILKRITEQLTDDTNVSAATGMVERLDLTGYWLQLPDLITLGDYLAVVPVREVIMENSGLSDEGLRVILAGLTAAKRPASKRRRPKHEVEEQGGVVERLVIKNNKLGPDGWKHLSLFLYLCRSLKYLDLSQVPFPKQPQTSQNGALPNGVQIPRSISDTFSRALAERLGGSTLELINLGETEPSVDQLSCIVDGLIRSGIKKIGLARNRIDEAGMKHVVRFLEAGTCEGLDLGGNDLGGQLETLASAIREDLPLMAISLAGCNLTTSSLCKILPTLIKLDRLRFIDFSHNHQLFKSNPSAVGLLRRYIPKMSALRRIHLEDVDLTAEQAIALVEIVPESKTLAHINILGNTELIKLADAHTEEEQEEACALYASLLSAARVSKSIICVDIEVPSENAGEIVKAMAKQVVAYCLRNMERFPDPEGAAAAASAPSSPNGEELPYPDVLVHLVGRDVLAHDESDDDGSPPDEDYVIGGTGVVKALTCCLQNRGDESRRQSGEFIRDVENGLPSPRPALTAGGKAKDMSKHLLAGARKIRVRLQPALVKARAHPEDENNLRKLQFLDETLQNIIKRFEDEYPDTRETQILTGPHVPTRTGAEEIPTSIPLTYDAVVSDVEDEGEIQGLRPSSRSNSILSRSLAEEEGRILRAGHRFRIGLLNQEQINLLSTIDGVGSDPKHVRMLEDMAEDFGGEFLDLVKEKGAARAFKEHKDLVFKLMEENDPDHWERFVEAQQKARANINLPMKNAETAQVDESAVSD